MRLNLYDAGPVSREPVTLEELRQHVRADSVADDVMLSGYLMGARAMVERYIGRPIVRRTVKATARCWAVAEFVLLTPVLSVDTVTYTGIDGVETAWVDFIAHTSAGEVTRVYPTPGTLWPILGSAPAITITATAGFNLVPDDVRQAILMIAAHWHEYREAVTVDGGAGGPRELPFGVAALLKPHRWRWLG